MTTASPPVVASGDELLRLAIDSVKDYAIFLLDAEGRVATWNAGAERIKGYAREEIVGQHVSRFYTEEDVRAGRPARLLHDAAEQGRVEDETWRVRKDGTRFWADVVITALRDASGTLRGYLKVTRDLTERRRLEEEQIRNAQAEEAIRLRDEFLSIASHELRTPLTVLQLQLDGLRERIAAMDEKTASKIDRAARNGERLVELVEALLDVSRITTGQLALAVDRLDLVEVVRDVVDRFRDVAQRAGCALAFSADGTLDGQWDRLRLEQVLTNLLSNAVKYGAGAPVEVSVAQRGPSAVIEVRDHGPGVPEPDLLRIFGRFERAASLRNYGGLGLGLYLARQIAEAHGGTVTALNEPDGGARFTVVLPAGPRLAEQPLAGTA